MYVADPGGRSLAGIMGSIRAGAMNVCLLWVLCVVRLRPLQRADPSSRGVLPIVPMCHWILSGATKTLYT
jgi:hypothetical protein